MPPLVGDAQFLSAGATAQLSEPTDEILVAPLRAAPASAGVLDSVLHVLVARAVVAAVVAVLAGACGAGSGNAGPPGGASAGGAAASTPSTASPAAGTPELSEATTAAVDRPVPEPLRFTAAGISGSPIAGADFAGQDVALWFWAPW